MHLDSTKKQEIFAKYGTSAKDTESVGSRVALSTYRTQYLTEHLKENKKDFSIPCSLEILVGKRRRLLDYLARKDIEYYRKPIAELGIRHAAKF